ncbi:MAG: hypothetical protein QOH56_2603 [Pseudonocardiales bacterium]|jgi:hypothetical protein|nr:hypothetical protein [Frankiales bacterium]MDQ1736352.1 hypothetical protein [Pseudonocardiales bacterium]
MTVFQLNRPQSSTLTPAATRPAHLPVPPGRHASAMRAKLSVRRMFYVARHLIH